MIKALIVSCVFPPEPVVSSRTSTDLANELCRIGYQVEVITGFPNRPAGKLYEGYQRRFWAHDRSFAHYEVWRCFSLFSTESRMLSRFFENLSFGITSGLVILFAKKPDVIYGNTWPIFAQGILAMVCFLRRIPLVLSIQDIYPETLLVQGRASKLRTFYHRPLRWLDKKIAGTCAAIVVISEQFGKVYVEDRGIASQKVHLIPNWVDEDQVLCKADWDIRKRYDIPANAFLVVYAGNVSFAAGLENVILAFQKLTAETRIYLLVAGEGSMLDKYQKLARKNESPHICFHTPWLECETSSLLAAADLFILPTQGEQSMFSVPSKLISYMLVGRPILACAGAKSEVARVISTAQCGWTISVANPEAICEKLLSLSEYPQEELAEYGKRGRAYALKEMTKMANLPKLIQLMDSVATSNRGILQGFRE
jgi:glycosyltransferase involved in cell wall biosynthesis